MNAIIVAVDRLHAGYLGCYGNAWVLTPEFNRLAAEGFVFDQCLIDSPQLAEIYESYWLGSHVSERRGRGAAQTPFAGLLEAAGRATTLICDDVEVCEHPLASAFGEVIRYDAPADAGDSESRGGGDPAETHLARFFAVACEWLAAAREPFCLWLHTGALGAEWDAPYEFRRQYADEDGPSAPDFRDVPRRMLPEDYDPDELLGICQAYAGQVSLLDLALGGLLELVRSGSLASNTLLAVTSARGFPLGEHRRIGPVDDALYGELVQAPWLLRMPDGLGAMDRSQALVQPADLFATLLDGLQIARPAPCGSGQSALPLVRGDQQWLRDHACIFGPHGERGLRTPAWYLRRPVRAAESEAPRAELYAKPDDRWEVNDVADRCPAETEALEQALSAFESAAKSGSLEQLAPLDEYLVDELS